MHVHNILKCYESISVILVQKKQNFKENAGDVQHSTTQYMVI